MIELLNRNQHIIGLYLCILFLNFVAFTVSEQTEGIISIYVNKGKIQKYLLYVSILFSVPIMILIYNTFRKKND